MSIAIVSDQVLCLSGFADLAAARDPNGITAIFPDLDALGRALKKDNYGLIVVDLSLSAMQTAAQMRALVEGAGTARVVGLDVRLNTRRREDVIAAGFSGYLLKTMSGQVVLAALDLIRAGAQYFSSEGAEDGAPKNAASLTDRQLEVLRLVVAGRPNKEIGKLLGISTPTVKLHLNRILRRLGARNRTEAAIAGLELLR